VTSEARRRLIEWEWPGNVRELHNVLASAAAIAESNVIGESDLPAEVARAGSATVTPIAELERAEVLRAMAQTQGNKMERLAARDQPSGALSPPLEKFGVTVAKMPEAA
jgi:transcriptional regulator of acetoin/glycerol metabolism